MIYTWDIGDYRQIILERDPNPLSHAPDTYQLKLVGLNDQGRILEDSVIDFNFSEEEPFDFKTVCGTLRYNNILSITKDEIDELINKANLAVTLVRK